MQRVNLLRVENKLATALGGFLKDFRRIPEGSRRFLKDSGGLPKASEGFPKDSERSRRIPENPEGLPKDPKAFRRIPRIPKDSKDSEGFQGFPKDQKLKYSQESEDSRRIRKDSRKILEGFSLPQDADALVVVLWCVSQAAQAMRLIDFLCLSSVPLFGF